MSRDHVNITINGQPLSAYLKEEVGQEGIRVRIEIESTIAKQVKMANAPKTRHSGTGSGRGPGKPKGLKRAKVYTKEEIARLNKSKESNKP